MRKGMGNSDGSLLFGNLQSFAPFTPAVESPTIREACTLPGFIGLDLTMILAFKENAGSVRLGFEDEHFSVGMKVAEFFDEIVRCDGQALGHSVDVVPT
jgi:hypothetical protein